MRRGRESKQRDWAPEASRAEAGEAMRGFDSSGAIDEKAEVAGDRRNDCVAIIGMACLFPGAPNLDAYWRNILGKIDAVTDAPPEAWDLDVYYDPDFADTDRTYCKRGGYLGALASFEPLAHGIPPIAVGGEPDQWLALQLARDALADAGHLDLPATIRRRTAVILGKGTYLNGGNAIAVERGLVVGQTIEIIKRLHPELSTEQIELLRDEMKRALPPIGPETVPGFIPNIIVGRIANRLDLMGPAYTVDAACASSLVAVQHAVRELRTGACDLVIAGGSQVWMPVPTLNLFCHLGALSRRQQIRPFDQDADGTLLGEGIGIVVLRRLADAERDGDRIYAVIRGVGVASDGRGLSVMAPRIEGEELALRRAYEDAGVSPQSVALIEAHGTGTPVGDLTEIRALTRIFGPREGKLATCAIGTVKSMISHTIPAAGVAGMIKTALALHHKVLPPTLHCDAPNPKLELEKTPFYINTETRPWIHGGPEPRRAGINAFGFGGINAHAVLEEYQPADRAEDPPLSHQTDWDSEVCVLRAECPATLLQQAERLGGFLERVDAGDRPESGGDVPVSLKDLAYTLNCAAGPLIESCRLAIVATSFGDLREKLARATKRLADPNCRQIKDKGGIYFFAEPLGRRGKLALLFPGEGAQYPNMLADLCQHFPDVRACFDQSDRILYDHPRGFRLSDVIFPRPAFSEGERQVAETKIMQMDLAIEAVLTANRAIFALLQRLALRPDLYVGHSTGEYSALIAGGILDVDSETRLASLYRALNRLYEEIAAEDNVPRAVLLAIGAERDRVESIAREVGGAIYLAMDNCPHQAVLVGEGEAATRAVQLIRQEGLIYEQLLFDRAYHTELFAPYAERLRPILATVPIRAAHTPVYSCTTATSYPTDPTEISQLIIDQWARPVEFRRTIETLYAEGVRIFVEAGPRGNLSTFVEDILRGRSFCAVPANLQRRSGLSQLNHLVGILAAQGVDLDLGYLYAHRQPRCISWREETGPARSVSSPKIALATRWPMLGLPDGLADRLWASRPEGWSLADQSAQSEDAVAEAELTVEPMPPGPSATGADAPIVAVPAGDRVEAMGAYLATMDQFLAVQEQVLRGFLAGDALADTAPTPPTDWPTVLPEAPFGGSLATFPLLGSVISWTPDHEVITRRIFDPEEDRYLADHTFGRDISVADPGLQALAVMPLTMSLEILAEVAALLVPGRTVIGLREIQANRWLTWDNQPRTLEMTARRLSPEGDHDRVIAQIWDLADGEASDQPTAPAVEAVVVLADTYGPAPAPRGARVATGLPSRWRPEQLYTEVMFHGPSWQGVSSIERISGSGASAILRILPTSNFFRSQTEPSFVLDPVALDAAGQVIGFWTAERLAHGKIIFPFRVRALDLYGPPRAVGERIRCVAEIQLKGDSLIRSDLDLLDANGEPWLRLVGWEDKRFEAPSAFESLLLATPQTDISTPWPEAITRFADAASFQCRRLATTFSSDRSFWKQVWAGRILSRSERAQFRRRRTPDSGQLEWLAGRTAAKEAIRQLLRDHYGLEPRLADIEIYPDEHGCPLVGGAWQESVSRVPVVSITHTEGCAIAIAGLPTGHEVGHPRIGVDAEWMRSRPEGFAETAFTPAELRLLQNLPPDRREAWLLRMWCAKEAIAKALGQGLIDGPRAVSIEALDSTRELIGARPAGPLARLFPDLATDHLVVYTAQDGDLIVALTRAEVIRKWLAAVSDSSTDRSDH